jgi:hypothetical protein
MTDDEIDRQTILAVRDTEKEVFDAAAPSNYDLDPYAIEERKALTAELSELEGWDGRPLSVQEQAASASDNYAVDRPLESAEIDLLQRQLAEERARREEAEANFNNYVSEPQRQEQLRQARERALQMLQDRGVYTFDDAATDGLVNELIQGEMEKHALRQQLQARHNDDVHQSLQRAFDEDPSLAETYHALMQGNPNSGIIKEMARSVLDAGDRAAEVLETMRDNPLLRTLRRSGPAVPFMPSSYRSPGPSRAAMSRGTYGGDEVDAAGFNERAVNDAIFDYATEE